MTLNGANDTPTIISAATATTPENVLISTAVYTVTAADRDTVDTKTYSFGGGVDDGKFNINSVTGAVTFKVSPDYETPADNGGNNDYDIIVKVTDAGGLSATQAVKISVTDVSETPNPFTLTSGTDIVTYTSGTNVVNGTTATMNLTDKLTGGSGSDTLNISDGSLGPFTFGNGTGATANTLLTNFETINLTDSNNGNHTNNVTFLSNFQNNGTLTINGAGIGGQGKLSLDASAVTSGVFIVTGGNDDDVIKGGSGADTISGGNGKDAITGGDGADSLNGGAGSDIFKYAAVSNSNHTNFDTITGFTSNSDKIQFNTTLSAITATAASLASATSSVAAARVAWFVDTANNQVIVFANPTASALNGGDAGLVEIRLAGTTTIAAGDFSFNGVAPAGIAGEPINLAITDLGTHVGFVTLTVAGMPNGWTLSEGTDTGNGTWTVQTIDPSALTVTTPTSFVGAVVLPVTATWTDADGITSTKVILDNVEAYAPGNPIFAISADDHLTASSAADLLVFAQPIANDVIHSFDVAHDKIDLIGFTFVKGFTDLVITDDANGNAVITTSAGSTITVLGVHAADLTAANFAFNVEPITVNAGTMTISDGAILPLGGVIENSGTIALGSTGSETSLQVLVESVKLQGGGQVVLSDSANNVIFGGAPSATLINVNNTISGAGQIGAGQMTLANAGLIVANGTQALVIDTGSNVVNNSGTLESTGSGGLLITSALANTGYLLANGGDIVVMGDATGAGSATISGAATLEFGASWDQHVEFAAGSIGTLKLDHSSAVNAFTGSVSGFDAGDKLDLVDVAFGSTTQITYTANNAGTGGTLTVSDGGHTVNIAVLGTYTAAGLQADAVGGSELAYEAAASNHTMLGGLANDILVGGAGDDLFLGGFGNDTLTGGAGSDVFKFTASDVGGVDKITDFDVAANSDSLDLRDLLVGESADAVSLDSYLNFSYDAASNTTVVDVMSHGTGAVDHQIQLQGFNATLLGSSDQAIIAEMLAQGKLTVNM